jgi:hypothetical protein
LNNRAQQLFDRLRDSARILALIGETEDLHLDCKEWSGKEDEAQRMLAKAACGMTNSEGGVLVIGMRARSVAKDEPDLIDSPAPVSDTSAVKSRVLDLVGQLVEPRIEGVQAVEVSHKGGVKSGFVVVYIPASGGPPRRSRKDWKFYQRIGSGTLPMEFFQIEERFGKRPPPKLQLYLEKARDRVAAYPTRPSRWIVLGLTNVGNGIARFPSVRYCRACGLMPDRYGINGTCGLGLPEHPTDNEWFAFRGGVDDVIFPGETCKITKLRQDAIDARTEGQTGPGPIWRFSAVTVACEISCEGVPTVLAESTIPEEA